MSANATNIITSIRLTSFDATYGIGRPKQLRRYFFVRRTLSRFCPRSSRGSPAFRRGWMLTASRGDEEGSSSAEVDSSSACFRSISFKF
eukprot:96990-Rhodomonas_salina.3